MSNNLRMLWLAAAAFLPFCLPATAGTAHCHCKIALPQGDMINTVSSIVFDLGDIAVYNDPINPQKDANQANCESKCSTAVHDLVQSHKDELCQRIGKVGSDKVKGYASVGTRKYRICQTEGYRCCAIPGTLTCPGGWDPDWNGPGNNKCKRTACTLHSPPFPPNNTLIGTWGFTWGNAIIQWGPANAVVPPSLKFCQ